MSSYHQASHRSVGRLNLRFRPTRLLLSGIAVSCAAALFFAAASQALSATYTFIGAVSTDWNNGANWKNIGTSTTGVLPGVGDTVDVNTADDPAGAGNGGLAGLVTISGNLTNNAVQNFYVGTDGDHNGGAAGDGTVNQTAGTLNLNGGNGWMKLGNVANSTSTYNMMGTATFVLTNDWYDVGAHGVGVLTLADNAQITTTNMDVGRWQDGKGTVTQGGTSVVTIGGTLSIGFTGTNGGAANTNQTSTYTLNSGTLNVNGGGNDSFHLGDNGAGTFTQNGGLVNEPNSWLKLGANGGSNSIYNMHAGTLNVGKPGTAQRLMVSASGGTSVFTQDSAAGATVINSYGDFDVGDGGGTGTYTIGGSANSSTLIAGTAGSSAGNGGGAMDIGWNGTGIVNQLSNSTVDLSSTNANGLQYNGNGTGGKGTYNLSGGTLITRQIFESGSSTGDANSIFNFNGGTLRAKNAQSPFMSGLAAANVQAGGAIIDPNGNSIAINQPLLNGVVGTDGGLRVNDSNANPGTLTLGGANTFNGGVTLVSGEANANATETAGTSGPFGATGIITFAGGTIGLQNGFDYSSRFSTAPGTAYKVNTEGSTTSFATGLGGAGSSLTKLGAGTLNLTTANTYTGATTVNGGTLQITGSIAGSSAINVNGGTLFIDVPGTITGSGPVTVKGGTFRVDGSIDASSSVSVGGAAASGTPTLSGSGTVTGTVAINGAGGGAAGHVAPGDNSGVPSANFGTTGTLTTGSMTINAGSVFDFDLGANTPTPVSDLVVVNGTLTFPAGVGKAIRSTINLNDAGGLGVGTYKIFSSPNNPILNFDTTNSLFVGSRPLGFQYAFQETNSNKEIDIVVTLPPTWSSTAANTDWANPANWNNGVVAGSSGTTTTTFSATFNSASTAGTVESGVIPIVPDAGRNVQNILFDGAAGSYVIGTVGDTAHSLHLSSGGAVIVTATVTNPEVVNAPLLIELDATYAFTNNSTTSTATLTIGSVSANAAGPTTITLNGTNTGANSIGVISNGLGTVSLVKSDAGTWKLSGSNTYTGGVTINGGTLRVNNVGALNTTTPNTVTFGPGSTGDLSLNGNTITIGGLSGTSTTSLVSNDSATPATLTVSTPSANSYAGVIADGTGGGALGLVVGGAGSLSLSGQSTYSAGTLVNSGSTLVVAGVSTVTAGAFTSGPIGTGPLTLPSGSTLKDGGGVAAIANSVSVTGNVAFGSTGSGSLTIDGTKLTTPTAVTIGGNPTFNVSNTTRINSVVSGTGPLTKTGAGTLLLTNTNTFSGGTNVNTGTLAALNTNGAGTTPLGAGNVTLGGGTLALRGQTVPGSNALYTLMYNQGWPFAGGGANVTLSQVTGQFVGTTVLPVATALTSAGGQTNMNFLNPNPNCFTVLGYPYTAIGNANNVQAYFSGAINITTSGVYKFTTGSDDGTMLWVDGGNGNAVGGTPGPGNPDVNNNFSQGVTYRQSSGIFLTAGVHTLNVSFYQGGGGAAMDVGYAGPDTGKDATVALAAPADFTSIPNTVLSTLSGGQTYANDVVVSSNSGIDVSGSLGATLGSLSIGANTLTVSSADTTAFGYALSLGLGTGKSVTLGTGTNSVFNVTSSAGGGAGQLALGPVGSAGGASSITKTGPGVLKMFSPGTYTGGTIVQQGTVAVSNIDGANPLGTGPITLSGGTLALQGSQHSALANQGLVAQYFNSQETDGYNSTNSYNARLNVLSQYFSKPASSGRPFLTPAKTAPTNSGTQTNLDFSTGSPDIFSGQGFTASTGNGTNYEALMTGYINITIPGQYSFSTASADGSNLFLDNQNTPIVFNNFNHPVTTLTGTPVTLSAGPHQITVDYYHDGTGNPASFQVLYSGPDTGDTSMIIPNSALRQGDASQSFAANSVNVTAPSTISVAGSLSATLGALTIGPNAPLTLSSPDETGVNYSLTMGATSLQGDPTFNINNSSGAGVGALVLGALQDNGTARTITVNGGGTLTLSATAASLVQNTVVQINGSSAVNSNATGALGSLAQVSVNGVASEFDAGATQTISQLSGNGLVNIAGSTTLTVGNAVDNRNSNFTGIIQGSGALAKNGTGTFTLGAPNAHTGGTTVNAGTLISSTTASLGVGPVTLNGGTLRVAGVGAPGASVVNFGGTSNSTAGGGTPWNVNNGGITSNPINSDVLTLTDGVNNEARSAWYNTQVPFVAGANGFSVSFTYQPKGGGSRADGITFVLQTQTAGPLTALGGGGGGLGYSVNDQWTSTASVGPSIAYEMNIYNGHNIGTNLVTSTTAPASLQFNKVDGSQPGGLSISTNGQDPGDPITVVLSYDPLSDVITENLTDTVTSATYTHTYGNLNLPKILNSNLAYIGFTGATGGLNATQLISNFNYSVSPPSAGDIYNNNVILPGGTTATIDVATTTNGETISMGNFSVGNGAGTTLNVTATTAPTNGAYTLAMGNTTLNGSVSFNVANNTNNAGLGIGTLVLGSLTTAPSTTPTVTKGGPGVLEIQGAPTINSNSAFVVNQGTLRFNNGSGNGIIGSGVTVSVNNAAVLELTNSSPSLSDGVVATHRAHVFNNSSSPTGVLVSGQFQQVGGIDGSGTTHVNDGSDLTADHIIQGALVIGDTGASPSLVTIAASNASGNPLDGGLVVAGALKPSSPFGSGSKSSLSSGSALDGSSTGSLSSPIGGAAGGGSAAVPEPSSLLLIVLGGLACLAPVVRRRRAKA
jgi:fibronectin-binding autotransporter adhesin